MKANFPDIKLNYNNFSTGICYLNRTPELSNIEELFHVISTWQPDAWNKRLDESWANIQRITAETFYHQK
jgi:hypothetical protein